MSNYWDDKEIENIKEEIVNEPEIKVEKKRSKNPLVVCALIAGAITLSMGSFGFGYGLGSNKEIATETIVTEETKKSSGNVFADITASANIETDTIGVVKNVSNSVVSISTKSIASVGFGRMAIVPSAGSGIIIYEDDTNIYIVTNEHVISDAREVTISIDDNIQVPATLVGTKFDSDLAVIKVSKASMEAAGVDEYSVGVFADSDLVEVGEDVIAMGNAAGEGKSATKGIISAIDKIIYLEDGKTLTTIQTDAAINGGNSGGALVNMKGEVVGVNTAKYSSSGYETFEGMGYSIPSNTVKEVVEEIITGGSQNSSNNNQENTRDAVLGVKGQTLTKEIADLYNLPMGVHVFEVVEGSAADNVGILPGDVLVGFDGVKITTSEELGELISNKSPGDVVQIELYRNGNLGKVDVTLKNQVNME